MVGVVEHLLEGLQFLPRRGFKTERLTNLRSSGGPFSTVKQLGPRVAPTLALRNEHVSASERVLKALNRTESVGASVDVAVFSDDASLPRSRNELERSYRHVGPGLSLDPTEKLDGLQDGLPGGCSFEANRLENFGEKVSNAAVAVDDLLVAAFIGRTSERFNEGDGGKEFVSRDSRKSFLSDSSVSNVLVEESSAGLSKCQRVAVEVFERTEPFLLPDSLRLGEDLRHQNVEEVQRVVQRGRFEIPRESEECCDSSIVRHSSDRWSPGRRRVACESFDARRRNRTEADATRADCANLFKALEGGNESRATYPHRSLPKPIEVALPVTFGNDEQLLEALPLRSVWS